MNTIDELNLIKKMVVIAIFSDDYFMNVFVLKGGNAIDLAYKISSRASIDIDVSMESDFNIDFEEVKEKLEKNITATLAEKKYIVFDFNLIKQPRNQSSDKDAFWGGYKVDFKIIKEDKFKELGKKNIDSLRRNAKVIGDHQEKKFTIDISKFEYCKSKKEYNLDNYTIYIYTPLMIIYEKLRAICQQMEEYSKIVSTNQKPRAKDFFDIYIIFEPLITLNDFTNKNNFKMLEEIFEIKKVPLDFLLLVKNYREFHRDSFNTVKDSVYKSFKLESYDFYFDYVLEKIKILEAFWKK